MRTLVFAAMICGAAGMGSRVEAAFVTYTQSGVGTGTLNGVAFTNAALTFVQTADTNNVIPTTSGSIFYSVQAVTSTVTVAGIGTVSFTVPTFTGVQVNGPYSGLGQGTAGVGGNSIFSVTNAIFGTYDLRTSIGPITGAVNVTSPGTPYATTGGAFILNSTTGNATYTAAVGASAVPEPSSLALSGVALAGLGAWARRRRTA